jgi:hypothetical protein
MEINEEQMPPTGGTPPVDKGVPTPFKPDTGSRPDINNPTRPAEVDPPVDPIPDMDPDGMEPDENESIN